MTKPAQCFDMSAGIIALFFALFITSVPPEASAQKLKRIPLRLSAPGLLAPARHFVEFGCPFAKGQLAPQDKIWVKGAGRKRLCQWRALDHWQDGSVRAAAILMEANLRPEVESKCQLYLVKKGSMVPIKSTEGEGLWKLHDDGQVMSIHVAALELKLRIKPALSLQNLTAWRVVLFKDLTFNGITKVDYWEWLEQGPLRQVLELSGYLQLESGFEIPVNHRLQFFSKESYFEIDSYFANNVLTGANEPIQMVIDSQSKWTRLATNLGKMAWPKDGKNFRLHQPRYGAARLFAGESELDVDSSNLRPVLACCRRRVGFSATLRDFSLLGAKDLAVNQRQELRLDLVSKAYPWRSGVAPQRVVRIFCGRRLAQRAKQKLVPITEVLVQTPKRIWPQLEDLSRHAAFSGMASTKAILAAKLTRYLDARNWRSHGLLWPGDRNAGDWRWDKMSAGNLEYDTSWGLMAAAKIWRRPDLQKLARLAARHLVAQDLDLSGRGLPFQHCPGHRGPMELGHMWADGLYWNALSSGDRRLWEAFEKLRQAWLRDSAYLRPEELKTRSLAWGLLFATCFERSTDSDACRERVKRFHRAIAKAPGHQVLLLDRVGEKKQITLVPVWGAAGILGEALFASRHARTAGQAIRRFLAAMAELVTRAWDKKTAVLASSLRYASKDGAFLGASGSCNGEEMMFFALGLMRAIQLQEALGGTAPKSWSSLAKRLLKLAPTKLRIEEKRFVGIQLSQLLWLYPRLFGFQP